MSASNPHLRIASTVNFAGVLKRPATADLDEVRNVLLGLKKMRGELLSQRERDAGNISVAAFYESVIANFETVIGAWDTRRNELENPPKVGDDERAFLIARLKDLRARAVAYGSQAATQSYSDAITIMGQEAKCLGDLLRLFEPETP
jgi:hypothetical protein